MFSQRPHVYFLFCFQTRVNQLPQKRKNQKIATQKGAQPFQRKKRLFVRLVLLVLVWSVWGGKWSSGSLRGVRGQPGARMKRGGGTQTMVGVVARASISQRKGRDKQGFCERASSGITRTPPARGFRAPSLPPKKKRSSPSVDQ